MKIFKTLTFAAVAAIAITLLLQLSITRANAGHAVPFKATFHGFAEAGNTDRRSRRF